MSLMEQIERAHAEDVASGRKVRRAEEVPPSYEAITPEWLTAVLCKGTPGAEVVSHALAFSSDGTSNRQRILLTYNEAGRAADLPPTIFCKGAMSLANRLLQGMAAPHGQRPASSPPSARASPCRRPRPITGASIRAPKASSS